MKIDWSDMLSDVLRSSMGEDREGSLEFNNSKLYKTQENSSEESILKEDGINIKQVDDDEIATWYHKATKYGDADAQFNLANIYMSGDEVEKNTELAIELYTRAAKQGLCSAQFELGWLLHEGIGVSKNYELAAHWYKKAAKQDHAAAQNNLAILYINGDGVDQNTDKAIELYKKSAKQDYAIAQENLGWAYANGNIVAGDQKESTKWFIKAANQGYASAQNTLGTRFDSGKGVEKDTKQAVKWYLKSAKQENMYAQYNLAKHHYYGNGVLKDYKEALKWYLKSAEQGHETSQLNLAKMYFNGIGTLKDYEEAEKWFRKSAEQGNVYAQYKLYKNREDFGIDNQESLDWLHMSADKGISRYKYALGRKPSVSDVNNEIKSYKKAVYVGYAKSQYLLGAMYYEKDTTKYLSKSKYWISKAYENSDSDTSKRAEEFWNKHELWQYKDFKYKNITEPTYEQKIQNIVSNALTSVEKKLLRTISGERVDADDFIIGYRLNGGIGTLRDPKIAIKHYKKASKEGVRNAESEYELGVIYYEENSVKDHTESKYWIKKAYESSDTDSAFLINKKAEEFWNKHELWKC
jgi:TPR repeat protein